MSSHQHTPKVILRNAYTPPAFWINHIDLTFDLDPHKTCVLNKMRIVRNPESKEQYLRLNGEELNLSRVLVNGQPARFTLEEDVLVIKDLPMAQEGEFELEIFTTCAPIKNTSLSGLYISNEAFFTQCEAEGFRRITYFLDRPDVMASYVVTLRADKTKYPVLLANGNLIDCGELDNNQHFATWQDPFKKPSYLFALVAGQLHCREQKITDKNGAEHLLQVYVRSGDLDKTEHALNCLKSAIAWDEARFNLSLDLERFMIVAVSDFNMGAMENKGLNIFNSKCILANPTSATDSEYDYVQSVVGHEYFHNWSGNRVTCRDWFQLSLKEGLTVFREQEFMQDLCSNASAKAVHRIKDVQVLRSRQWPEDSSPMAHPVRPDSYIEINNFYTVTIYEKGAEVIRMMQTLVGRDGFAKGLALYFQRNDGKAVTCDEFAQAIADANQDNLLYQNLEQFKLWYSQIGTPLLQITDQYDEQNQRYVINIKQSTPIKPEQQPMLIPLTIGLLTADGNSIELQQQQQNLGLQTTLVITQAEQSFTFEQVPTRPIPSLLRNFSAPVKIDYPYTDQQLISLLKYDTDAFNQWESCQRLITDRLLNAINNKTTQVSLDQEYLNALVTVLTNQQLDPAFKTLALTLPTEAYLSEQLTEIDPQLIYQVIQAVKKQIAQHLAIYWEQVFVENQISHGYQFNDVDVGKRSLTALALENLCLLDKINQQSRWLDVAMQQLQQADNLTDKQNALGIIINNGDSNKTNHAIELFYQEFKHNELVIDNWFSLQAGANNSHNLLNKVQELIKHTDFNFTNPNRVRSVIARYCSTSAFHQADGSGYQFWVKQVIKLNDINPQIASSIARRLDNWKKLAQPYREQALKAMQQVIKYEKLSSNVKEIMLANLADINKANNP